MKAARARVERMGYTLSPDELHIAVADAADPFLARAALELHPQVRGSAALLEALFSGADELVWDLFLTAPPADKYACPVIVTPDMVGCVAEVLTLLRCQRGVTPLTPRWWRIGFTVQEVVARAILRDDEDLMVLAQPAELAVWRGLARQLSSPCCLSKLI